MSAIERLKQHRMSFILLLFMYLNLAWSINAADWSEGLGTLQWVVGLSILIGFLLALSRWPAFLANLYSLVTGAISIVLLVSTQLSSDLPWSDRVLEVGLRVRQWIGVVFSGQVSYDNLVFVLQLAVYLWIFGYLSAWGLFRRGKTWWAVVPPGVGLLLNLYYAPPKLSAYFVIYLLLALVLVVKINFQRREAEWASRRITYTSDVSFDFLRDGMIIALLVIVLAWALPVATSTDTMARIGDRWERPWRAVQEEWNRMFASLTSHVERGETTFGRIMTFSGTVNLGDTPIADIEADEGRYWRAVAYDFYGGRGWASTYEEIGVMGEGASPIAPPPYDLRNLMPQKVQVLLPSTHSIIAAPQLTQVDVATEALLLYLPREGATAARPPTDIELAYSQYRLRQGDVYKTVSSVSKADKESLQEAGADYPQWVRDHYLQLPADLPQRVHDLSAEITESLRNNYDRATAIETYLRQITYNERIADPPPSTEDAVDYFLFEMKEGYCDYYASAMVVLARSAGIPARLVQGYAEDEKLEDTNTFHIEEDDGHAWPELFFPQYGWIEFEPTAAESIIERPERQAVPQPNLADLRPEMDDLEDPFGEDKFGPDEDVLGELDNSSSFALWLSRLVRSGRTVGAIVLGLSLLAGIGWVVWRVLEPRRLTPAQRAYYRLTRFSHALVGSGPNPQQTPYEYAGFLATEVPYAGDHIRSLVTLYVQDRFATTVSESDSAQALELWRKVLPSLLRRSVERVAGWFGNRARANWTAVRRLGRPRTKDGRHAG